MTHKIVEDLRPLAMPIDDCHLDPANARTGHDVDQIAGSLHAYGQRKPIVINRLAGGRIEAGNGTWQAAKALGWTEIAAVVVEDDPMTAVGFAVADNRTAELSRWDGETLKALLDGLDPDLELPTGFKEGELDALLAELGAGLGGDGGGGGDGNGDAKPQIDRAAELQGKWGTAVGQLWQIGGHRLLIGDCTVGENVARLMGGEKAEMMFTDPPYGVGYTGGHFHSGDVNIKRERKELANDENAAIYTKFLPVVLPFVDGACYMWFAGSKARDVYNAVFDARCEIHALIIWHKTNATYAAMNAQYKQRHEPCLYFKPKGSTLRWCGATTEATLWEIKRDGVNNFHPTQKPIELATKAIKNHEAKTVLDVFLGSGSTMVAAENTGRRCYGMEISPAYGAVILERMAEAFPALVVELVV